MFLRRLIPGLAAFTLLLTPGVAARASVTDLFTSYGVLQQQLGAYGPSQIDAAYDISPLQQAGIDGTGQTIALIELDGFKTSDLAHFDATYGLPAPVIRQFYAGGKKFTLQHSGESTLDLEWAHALAPGASLQVYYIKNGGSASAGWKALAGVLRQAHTNGAGTVSMSFGTCRADTGYAATRNALAALLQAGVSTFVSSGDTGDHPGTKRDCGSNVGVAYPASDPSVVAVGGTSLTLNSDGTIGQEVAWDLSGGGKGVPLLRPLWQVAASIPSDQYRWAPDVAFLGDPHTGVAVYYKAKWYRAGGTSLGAPAWAAIWSLLQQDASQSGQTIAPAPPTVYRIGNSPASVQVFHDITEGSNGLYSAGPGWDAVTGWGTPDVNGLAQILLNETGAAASP